MESITLGGITFRWNGDALIITTQAGQKVLNGGEAAQLLDFLQHHQQSIFTAEQYQLPSWARPEQRYVTSHISEEAYLEIERSDKTDE